MPDSVFRSLGQTFLRGLAILIPIAVTGYVVYATVYLLERSFRAVLLLFVAEEQYVPGLGLFCGFTFVFLLGWGVRYLPLDGLIRLFENIIDRIPFVRTVYSSSRDFSEFLSGDATDKFAKAVVVQDPNQGYRFLGYITSKSIADDLGIDDLDTVAVYLPMSYQVGGYTTIVPRDWVQDIDLNAEAALKYIFTAGISKK